MKSVAIIISHCFRLTEKGHFTAFQFIIVQLLNLKWTHQTHFSTYQSLCLFLDLFLIQAFKIIFTITGLTFTTSHSSSETFSQS